MEQDVKRKQVPTAKTKSDNEAVKSTKKAGSKATTGKAATDKTAKKKTTGNKENKPGKTRAKKKSDNTAASSEKKNSNSNKKDIKESVKKVKKKDIKKDSLKNEKKDSLKNESEVMALSAVSFVLNTVLTVLFYVIVVIVIVKASKATYNFGYQIYGNVSVDAAPGRTVNVVIEDGETTMNVASKLELNKIIENKYSFFIRTKLSGKSIYPGTYQVNTSMNYQQILDVIADYDVALENKEENEK